MQEYERDSRLVLLSDSETGQEVWLRRHGLQLRNREYMRFILSTERRGSEYPMTAREIMDFFLGEKVRYIKRFDTFLGKGGTSAKGICYHPTEDIGDSFYKDYFEAPAVGHVLWTEAFDELHIRSIAVDADFPFRMLMYRVLLDELKSFVVAAAGYSIHEKISAVLHHQGELSFYECNAFRPVTMPEGQTQMVWQPEFEGMQKENR